MAEHGYGWLVVMRMGHFRALFNSHPTSLKMIGERYGPLEQRIDDRQSHHDTTLVFPTIGMISSKISTSRPHTVCVLYILRFL